MPWASNLLSVSAKRSKIRKLLKCVAKKQPVLTASWYLDYLAAREGHGKYDGW